MMGRLNPSPDPDLSILHSAVSEILPDGLLRVPCSPLREREFELCGVPGRFIPHVHAHGMHMHMDTDMHVQHLAGKRTDSSCLMWSAPAAVLPGLEPT
jgi:hypothetical protein